MILDIIIQYPLTSACRLSVFLKHIPRTAREEKCESYDDSSAYCSLITSLSFILLISHLGKQTPTSAPTPFANRSSATNPSTKSTTVNLRTTTSGTTGINYQNATTERERSSSNNDKLWLIILAVVLVDLATIFGIVLFLRCRRQKLYRPSGVDTGENRRESSSIQMHDTVVTLPER